MATDDAPVTLGRALEQAADTRDLSDREAGEQIGVAQQTFTRWANGQAIPHPDYLPDIARFLGYSEKKTRDLWKASERPRADRRTAARLERIEGELVDIRKAMMKLLARLPDPDA